MPPAYFENQRLLGTKKIISTRREKSIDFTSKIWKNFQSPLVAQLNWPITKICSIIMYMSSLRVVILKNDSLKYVFAGIILVLLLGISIALILPLQARVSERPNLSDSKSISRLINRFTTAKNLDERMACVTKSSRIQQSMRTYVVVPFTQRKILDQKITIDKFSYDQEGNRKTATVVQELTYISEKDGQTHLLETSFELENRGKWLIDGFSARVIKQER